MYTKHKFLSYIFNIQALELPVLIEHEETATATSSTETVQRAIALLECSVQPISNVNISPFNMCAEKNCCSFQYVSCLLNSTTEGKAVLASYHPNKEFLRDKLANILIRAEVKDDPNKQYVYIHINAIITLPFPLPQGLSLIE